MVARLPDVEDTGLPPRAADGRFQLDATQRPIAHASPNARLVVEAGPGHGKTAVACARVAHLLEQGVPGTQILLLSFTRTAVREMRQRIRELAQTGVDVVDIRIATIDSWAARLRNGFIGDDPAKGGFDFGITRLSRLLQAPTDDLSHHLGELHHILIDEAQDLVGPRARLIDDLLRSVSPACGFTVFFDPAQGIYDWAENAQEEGQDPVRLADLLHSIPGVQPVVSLGYLHRTADPDLRRLLLGARSLVLDAELPRPASRLRSILSGRMSPGRPDWRALVPTLPDDALILFRRRGPVLDASAWLAGAGIPHRLRIGGLPQPVAPWVAALLHDAFEQSNRLPILSRESCEVAWTALGDGYITRGWSFERAWPVLRRMAAEGRARIDVRRVADALLRGQVPDDLHTRELGPGGPVLGTVHGSKGREASRVVFVVPAIEDWRYDDDDQKADDAEAGEARVLYVAITRAKERLDLYDGGRCYWSKIRGRDWTLPRRGDNDWQRKREGDERDRVRFEVGREGDLDPACGMLLCPGGPMAHQGWLRGFDGRARVMVGVWNEGSSPSAWEIRPKTMNAGERDAAPVLATLAQQVENDITEALAQKDRLHASRVMSHLYQLDITTTALRPDHPKLDHLPEPWRTLRLILAPVVVGLGSTYARKR